MRWFLSSCALISSACLCQPGAAPIFACTTDDGCSAPFHCIGGVCAGPAGGGRGTDEDAGEGGGSGGSGGSAGGGTMGDALLIFLSPPTVKAGACTPLTLELKNGSSDVLVTVSAAPAGLALFSDAACSMQLNPTTLGPASPQLLVHLRALTAQTYTVTAQSTGLMPASVPVPVLPIVRRGQCQLQAGISSVLCAVTPAQENLDETWLVYQASGEAANDHASLSTRCTMASTSSVLCERLGATGEVTLAWQTAEVPGLRVQRADLSCDGTAMRTLSFPIAADPAKTFATYAVKQTGAYWSSNDAFAATVRAGAIDFAWEAACDENATITAQLVEWPGATVTRGTLGVDAGVATLSTANLAIAQAAFALATWSTNAGISDAPCASMLRLSEPNVRQVTFTRGDAGTCLAKENPRLAWERVDLGRFGRVQQLTVAMAAGTGLVAVPVQPVDATRTLVFAGGQTGGQGLAIGEGRLDSKSSVSDFAATFRLSTDQVFAERKSTDAASRWTVFVVELSP